MFIYSILVMSKSKEARELFENGFSCAQSVLYTHGKAFFKDPGFALKLASPYKAGISYRGEICGAVSGSLMVIGLHYGYSDQSHDLSKEMTHRITSEFLESFEKENGSLTCNRLLNVEINTPDGLEYARKNGLFETVCTKLVAGASELLEDLIKKYPPERSAGR